MIRKSLLSIFTILVLTGSVFCQDKFVVPDQKVTGAEEAYPNNEVIVLKVTPMKEKPKYLQTVSYNWLILADDKEKKNLFVYPDNTTVGFGRGDAKKIKAVLKIDYLYVVHEKDDPEGKIVEVGQKSSGFIFTDIKFKDDVKPEPDNPNPPTPNVPVLPDGKFGLAKPAYNNAIQNVPVASRANGAQAVATSTEGIAAAIRAGTLNDPTAVLQNLKQANNAALQFINIPVTEWDAWGTAMQKSLYQLYKDKKLNVVSDYADAFDEIAKGLRAVK